MKRPNAKKRGRITRARFAEATVNNPEDCDLQIVLEFETTEERLLVKHLLEYNKPGFHFWLHGVTYACFLAGPTSINFGFVRRDFKTAERCGYLQALSDFAWWKDGVQYVGCGTKTLKQAQEDFKNKGETP